MPPRTTAAARASGDTRAATSQLSTADQSARVARETRAKAGKGKQLTAPYIIKNKDDKEAEPFSQEFRLADDVGIMPLMEWAAASDQDVTSANGLRAVFYVLQDAVHEEEWAEFRRFSREHKATAEETLEFANSALEARAGRPTEAASGSSDG